MEFAHYSNEKGVSSDELAILIPEVIKAVNSTGLKVRGIIADQASTNESALTTLIEGSDTIESRAYPYFNVGNENTNEIYVVFDLRHMIKCFRNN